MWRWRPGTVRWASLCSDIVESVRNHGHTLRREKAANGLTGLPARIGKPIRTSLPGTSWSYRPSESMKAGILEHAVAGASPRAAELALSKANRRARRRGPCRATVFLGA